MFHCCRHIPSGFAHLFLIDQLFTLRQSHKAILNKKTDIFFLCVLSPRSYDITEQKSEILEAKV